MQNLILLQTMSQTSIHLIYSERSFKNGSDTKHDCESHEPKYHPHTTPSTLPSLADLMRNPTIHTDCVSPFSPYLESPNPQENYLEKTSVTDRFIPSRKLLKRDSMYQENPEQ